MKNKCGSCWTFSTTGAIEAHYALYKNKSYLFSEQELVDCAQAFNNHGCSGGLPSQAFEFIKYNGGIATEDEYPYKAEQSDSCSFNNSFPVLGHVKNSVNITQYDEDSLVAAVGLKGPVSVTFEVTGDFRLYKSGVYSTTKAKCPGRPEDVNHAVLAVGYGDTEDNEKFWIIKNSWGESFGMDGYFLMERGSNMCGIATCNSWPVV